MLRASCQPDIPEVVSRSARRTSAHLAPRRVGGMHPPASSSATARSARSHSSGSAARTAGVMAPPTVYGSSTSTARIRSLPREVQPEPLRQVQHLGEAGEVRRGGLDPRQRRGVDLVHLAHRVRAGAGGVEHDRGVVAGQHVEQGEAVQRRGLDVGPARQARLRAPPRPGGRWRRPPAGRCPAPARGSSRARAASGPAARGLQALPERLVQEALLVERAEPLRTAAG